MDAYSFYFLGPMVFYVASNSYTIFPTTPWCKLHGIFFIIAFYQESQYHWICWFALWISIFLSDLNLRDETHCRWCTIRQCTYTQATRTYAVVNIQICVYNKTCCGPFMPQDFWRLIQYRYYDIFFPEVFDFYVDSDEAPMFWPPSRDFSQVHVHYGFVQ